MISISTSFGIDILFVIIIMFFQYLLILVQTTELLQGSHGHGKTWKMKK